MVPEIGILSLDVAGFPSIAGEILGATVTRSKQIIEALKRHNAAIQHVGFPSAVAALAECKTTRAAARAIIPDGYWLDHDEREIVLYEVADTHPIRPSKADKIADLYDELEQEEWTLRVVVLDYTGHIVADVQGWAFSSEHTAMFAPANCLDMTPAARAAAIHAAQITADQDNAAAQTLAAPM